MSDAVALVALALPLLLGSFAVDDRVGRRDTELNLGRAKLGIDIVAEETETDSEPNGNGEGEQNCGHDAETGGGAAISSDALGRRRAAEPEGGAPNDETDLSGANEPESDERDIALDAVRADNPRQQGQQGNNIEDTDNGSPRAERSVGTERARGGFKLRDEDKSSDTGWQGNATKCSKHNNGDLSDAASRTL